MSLPKWFTASLSWNQIADGLALTTRTDKPCHGWLRWSADEPKEELVPIYSRGVIIRCEKRYFFSNYHDVEQNEDGDTVHHTFFVEPWPVCERRWWYFISAIGGTFSPSTSAVFTRHRYALPPYSVFYPSPCPNAPVDGRTYRYAKIAETWPQIRNGPGTNAFPCTAPLIAGWLTKPARDKWSYLLRVIILFDLTSIPASHYIIAATLDLYISRKNDATPNYPRWAIYHSNPNSNNTLIPSDHNTLGDIPLSKILSHSEIIVGQYNSFPFNELGLTHIKPHTIVKLGLREARYDAPNNTPTWSYSGQTRIVATSADSLTKKPPRLTIWHKSP